MNRSGGPLRTTGTLSFSGHETFTLRHGWLAKAVDAVQANSAVFNGDGAMLELGVGKNMVRSIRHWALAAGMVAETQGSRGANLYVTELGKLLFDEHTGLDRFNEDPNTLWVVQWRLCSSERRSTTWCWAFNLLTTIDFTRDGLQELVNTELQRRNLSGPSAGSLRRDIDCFLRCYIRETSANVSEDALECPLADTSLIQSSGDRALFSFNRGPQPSLSDQIFIFALMEYWESNRPDRETLAFSDLAFGFCSPGLVFKLDELSLITRLERLHDLTSGELTYTDTAGLRQVYRKRKRNPVSLLEEYYRSLTGIGVAV